MKKVSSSVASPRPNNVTEEIVASPLDDPIELGSSVTGIKKFLQAPTPFPMSDDFTCPAQSMISPPATASWPSLSHSHESTAYQSSDYQFPEGWLGFDAPSSTMPVNPGWHVNPYLLESQTSQQDIDSYFSSGGPLDLSASAQQEEGGFGLRTGGSLQDTGMAHEIKPEPIDYDDVPTVDISQPHLTPDTKPATGSRKSSGSDSSNDGKRKRNRSTPMYRERNRVAAAKCRSKKKVKLDQLEADARQLESENTSLTKESLELRMQQSQLRELALHHDVHASHKCQCTLIHRYNMERLGQMQGIETASISAPVSRRDLDNVQMCRRQIFVAKAATPSSLSGHCRRENLQRMQKLYRGRELPFKELCTVEGARLSICSTCQRGVQ